jgi:purine nucleosidase
MNIILDVDTGEDDALAILLAANLRLGLKLVVSSYGNSTIENTTRNTRAIVGLAGLTHCPVFRGASAPLGQHKHFLDTPTEWESAAEFLGSDGLCGVSLPETETVQLITTNESERVARLAEQVRQLAPVHYVVTGPCTNLAELCAYFGVEVTRYISNVSVMGGALNVPGNSGPRDSQTGAQLAEFNFYCDPFAVNTLLKSGLPIYIVPWDTTHRLTIPFSRIETLRAHNAQTRFITDLMKRFFTSYGLKSNREFEFNDPAAVWLPLFAPEQFKAIRLEAIESSDGFGGLREHAAGFPVLFHSCTHEQVGQTIEALLQGLELT